MALFFCHLSGLLFLAVLVACQEKEGLLPLHGARLLHAAAPNVGLVALMLLPSALLTLASPFDAAVSITIWSSPSDKFAHLFSPVLNYSPTSTCSPPA